MRVGLLPVPPEEFSWAVGKTAYSINFVLNAREYIAAHPDIPPSDLAKLQIKMIALQDGTESLSADIDVDVWLHPPSTPQETK